MEVRRVPDLGALHLGAYWCSDATANSEDQIGHVVSVTFVLQLAKEAGKEW